jgi:hypothetical protein
MDSDPDINPYESPKTPCVVRHAHGRSTFRGMWGNFTVHVPEPHQVEVYCSRWTGLEVYTIDGVERLRVHSFGFTAVRQFVIENAAPHQLEIVVKAIPWWRGHVSLDGQRIIDDLFPAERKIGIVLWLIVLLWATAGAAFITLKLGRPVPFLS